MTKIRERGPSSQIEDRRGQGGGGGGLGGLGGLGGMLGRGGGLKAGGGLIGVIVLLAAILLPRLLGGASSNNAVTTGGEASADGNPCDDAEINSILCGATEDVQDYWTREFEGQGNSYEATKTVFFSGYTLTGCGQASAETGPFYCPADKLVYFDLDFLQQLQNQFGATGDLAAQYIVAHEYGHHVQNITGISTDVRQQEQADPSRANEWSVGLELQADCFAGAWAHDANTRNQFENATEVNEAIEAAGAVGDDRIQEQTQGRVDPESFTHGTSEQRMTWFRRGFDEGTPSACNTFAELGL
jgi:predicted metalloprotease